MRRSGILGAAAAVALFAALVPGGSAAPASTAALSQPEVLTSWSLVVGATPETDGFLYLAKGSFDKGKPNILAFGESLP